ncbi:MAG: CPBP family intramembrane glutamic endopeptidase [Planctomycetota bacterium]
MDVAPSELQADASVGWPLALLSAGLGVSISWILVRLVLRWMTGTRPGQAPSPPSLAKLGLLTLGLQLVMMLLMPALLSAFDSRAGGSGRAGIDLSIAATITANLTVILIVLPCGRIRSGLALRQMGLALPSFHGLLLATMLLLAAAPAFYGASLLNAELVRWLDWETHQALVKALLEDPAWRDRPAVLAAIILIVPLLEEILFRGLIQNALRVAVGPFAAILGASLLFALLHDLQSSLPVFVVGLALGLIFEKTRSALASAWAHALFNGLQILLISSDWT